MGQDGNVWEQWEINGTGWKCMRTVGNEWDRMGTDGTGWQWPEKAGFDRERKQMIEYRWERRRMADNG